MLDPTKIYILDNITSETESKFIEEQFTNHNTQWVYNNNTIDDQLMPKGIFDSPNLNHISNAGQFVHVVMHSDKSGISSPHSRLAMMILQNLCDKLYFNIDKMMRIKVNFNLKEDIRMMDSCYPPHCDALAQEFWTAIYYVNDSDGDTIIFNEYNDYTKFKDLKSFSPPEKFSILQKVSAKRGSIVLFDGNRYHAGSPPINSNSRIVINFNFTIKE